jgi:hypothetical protein
MLVSEKKEPGTYEGTFDGTRLTSGVYFCRMVSGTFTYMRKMLLLR